MADRLHSYQAFWPVYLRAHRRPGTRLIHYAGSLLVIVALALYLATGLWWLLPAMPVIGYGFAWGGHFYIEGNRPATFGHPAWSLFSDFRMLALWLTGGLAPHLRAAGIGQDRGAS